MRKVVIATINFNSEKETHACLLSLEKLNTKDITVEIVVIDNGSNKPFVLTNEEEKRKIHLINTGKNLGFTGGSNVGIDFGLEHNADFVMLINNDTIVHPELLHELLKPFEDPQVGLVVPKIYFAKGHEYHLERYKKDELGKVLWFAGGYVDWVNVFTRHRGVDEVDHGQYDRKESTTFATGCCILISKQAIENVGKFDDNYYLYFEDGDLSQRLVKKGYKIIYNPKAILWHITAASGGGSGSPLHDYYLTRNRMLFGMRYAPFRSKIALVRESLRLLFSGRPWQKKAIWDFYTGNMKKGSYGR